MKRILLSSPHMSGNEQKYIGNAFKENWIAPLGPNVNQFELDIAAYAGVKGASVTSSGTGAIHLALDILGVKQGDSVFCSTFTFVASANPALYLGADITFIDSEVETWNMSPFALERALSDAKKIGKLPKAIIVVNLYGQSAQMDELLEIANSYKVPIIEDAAESLGAEYKGKKSGTLGKIGIYSFNGNKIITTSGGGVLISDDEEIIARSRFLATQARDEAPHYQHSVVGYNYRMSNILAGVGIAQLQVLDERVARRREIFDTYYQELAGIEGVQFMPELNGTKSNRWLTTLTIDQKIIQLNPYEIMDKMNEANIETRALWKPLHMQPLFKENKFYKEKNSLESTAGLLFANGLCLPSGSNMTNAEQTRVIEAIKKIALNKK
ncbi:DegT/DnrJ/EryC1/StrS family aminotransferase [Carnobacterium maltaromaticum]|uniref:DegT/DnrJ/EryC1/StrS family aminotransferase n=1 Tax=Carnobacterium maltaromaticum TaxID=2751 RepID=UPI0010717F73|nr:DegT/DnrJ/EryC1/StrS family aminotransferase [Carnobacterium maltaromaticum]TFJ71806.1 pyridoxal phosphate-dependent aminotransferase [Carnobacterium maltaromaticum]TFJ76719.1 pyridoxal phosphate-dependent aminotransferase [Carnobacterium maltaromaticum]